MRFGMTAIALAAALAATAPAQAQAGLRPATSSAYDANRIVTQVTQQDLVALVRQRGDTIVSERRFGDVSILAKTRTGLLYVIRGAVCGETVPGCLGIVFEVRYDADERATLERINTANLTYEMTKTTYGLNEDGEKTVMISHYTILDRGQRMGNLSDALLNVLDIAPKVSEIVFP